MFATQYTAPYMDPCMLFPLLRRISVSRRQKPIESCRQADQFGRLGVTATMIIYHHCWRWRQPRLVTPVAPRAEQPSILTKEVTPGAQSDARNSNLGWSKSLKNYVKILTSTLNSKDQPLSEQTRNQPTWPINVCVYPSQAFSALYLYLIWLHICHHVFTKRYKLKKLKVISSRSQYSKLGAV